jgi:pseudouridine synthase
VNGIVETSSNRLVSRTNDCIEVAIDENDTSWVDVIIPMPRYYACYKPRGVVCSSSRNVTDKLESILISEWLEDIGALKYPSTRGLQTVGRLDEDSEGLLLLTDDGSFSRLLCDPEFGFEKTYRVVVRGSHYHEMMTRIQHPHELGVTTKDALSKQVSDMVQRGTLRPPYFTYKSCLVHDVGRLDNQHSSDDSYYALVDLVLQEGKRHAVRRIIKNASTTSTTAGGCGGGAALRVCYLSRIALERLAGVGVIMPKTLLDAQTMGFMPGVDCARMVPAGKLVCRTSSNDPLILHSGQITELRDCDVDRIFYKEGFR